MFDKADARHSTLVEFEDAHLALVRLLSAGVALPEIANALNTSKWALSMRLPVAKAMLGRKTGLSGEALSAIISPRAHGARPRARQLPRYSGAAVSIDRAYDLDAFHRAAAEVAEASKEWHSLGLGDLTRWMAGWRPADHDLSEAAKALLAIVQAWELVLFHRPEGFRFKNMIGAVRSVALRDVTGSRKASALMGYLIADVRDPGSSMVLHKNATVGVPLSEDERVSWQRFAAEHGGVRKAGKAVRLVQVGGAMPLISFESL